MSLRQQIALDLGQKIAGCTVSTKFGHGSLEIGSKVFAFTRTDESAALKLPEARIIELIQSDGEIRHLAMGKRTMREWVVIPNIAASQNLPLLHEAKAYVASLPEERRNKPAKKSAAKTTATKKAAKKRLRKTAEKKTRTR